MAKYGEGDKRWIVEDRPDGANVHNWHWAETDCLEWSRTFLNRALSNLTVLNGEANLFLRINKIEKLDGEAYVNVRKGKIIPGYELNVSISWEGEAKDSDGVSLLKVEGLLDIPYISDENADEDPEVRVSVKDEGPVGKRLKEAMVSKGKPLVLEKVRSYVQSMAKGGPCKDELEAKKVGGGAGVKTTNTGTGASNSKEVTAIVEQKKEKESKKKKKEGFKTISLTEKFSCRAKDLYEILMDENRWKGFSQSNTKISREVGGDISFFDGSVTGKNLELQEGKLIVQKWRFGSWPDGIESTVGFAFDGFVF